jgi:hypothetical protein
VANGCNPKMMAQSHVTGFLWLTLLLALGPASKFFRLLGLRCAVAQTWIMQEMIALVDSYPFLYNKMGTAGENLKYI